MPTVSTGPLPLDAEEVYRLSEMRVRQIVDRYRAANIKARQSDLF